ncbi:MAG TPA: hypothetical protein VF705_06795 [Longimicrobium sp.]
MATAKDEIEGLLSRLPDDCSIEDVQYHLYVLEKVRLGIESAETQPTLTQEEAEVRLRKWLTP